MKQHTKNMVETYGAIVTWLALMLLAMAALLLSGGCSTTKYVPVERTVTRIEYRDADTTALMNRWRSLIESMRQTERTSDSVVDREKETVTLNDKGDTVRLIQNHYIYVSSKREKELEREVSERDSTINALRTQLASVKIDSVYVEKPIEVGRKLTKWEQVKMDFGGMFLGGLIAVVVSAVIVWIVKRKRRK
nr:MAG TPA: Cell-membrane associated Mucin15 [Caudoviricetes sp.]